MRLLAIAILVLALVVVATGALAAHYVVTHQDDTVWVENNCDPMEPLCD